MKIQKAVLMALMTVLGSGGVVCAAEGEETGLYGDIFVGAMLFSMEDNLSTEDDNKKASALRTPGHSDVEAVLTTIELGYRTDSGTDIYVELLGDYALGITHEFDSFATVSVKGMYEMSEVWENPYLKNVTKKETDVDRFGGEILVEEMFGTGLGIDYTFFNIDVDKDTVGDIHENMKRDGVTHNFGVSYLVPLNEQHMIQPRIEYERGDMDGTSQSYDRIGGQLHYMYLSEGFVITMGGSYGKNDYDAVNPIFSKTREDESYGVDASITWFNVFDFEDVYITLSGGYAKSDSNINYYDTEISYVGLGVGYSF